MRNPGSAKPGGARPTADTLARYRKERDRLMAQATDRTGPLRQ